MLRTIRAQLAASYALVALLSVLAVGVVALSLLRRHIVLQEQRLLDSSAEALAGQLWPLMLDTSAAPRAHRLVSSAAFLSGARVRVLDRARKVLIDSGSSPADADFVWLVNEMDDSGGNGAPALPAGSGPAGTQHGPFIVAISASVTRTLGALGGKAAAGARTAAEADVSAKAISAAPLPLDGSAGADVMVLRRRLAPFGDQFVYQVEPLSPAADAVPWRRLWHARASNAPLPGLGGLPAGAKLAITASLGSPSVAFERSVDAAEPLPARHAVLGERVAVAAIGAPPQSLGYVEFRRNVALGGEGFAAAGRAFGWAALGAMALATFMALVVSRGLTAPLAHLAAAAGRMRAGDLSARAPVGGSFEVAALAGQFNAMAAQIEANFEAIAADRDALRRFIADASHELRTPITALKTFNSLLEGAPGVAAGDSAEFVTESRAQIERLEWLTQNLLDLSRLESGLVRLESAPVPVAAVVAAAMTAQRPLAEARGVIVESADVPESILVTADRRWLELALVNLINNGVKFTPPGGRVRIGADVVADGAGHAAPGAVRLWVSDAGPGVPEDERERIFDRFYRGQAAAGGAVPGSGLGLAIVRGVAEAHGGRAWVEPRDGAGSRFVVELPRP